MRSFTKLWGPVPTPVPDEEKRLEAFGPPTDTENLLSSLNTECEAILKNFDAILELPNLASFQVINPFRAEKAPNEVDNIDIRSMVLRYQGEYRELQRESVEVVRELASYASTQATLLPYVKAGKISLVDYLKGDIKLIETYKKKAAVLHLRYIKLRDSWHDARVNLLNSIRAAKNIFQENEEKIRSLKYEKSKTTIFGILELVGGLSLFAIGCFTMPWGLLAICGGGALLFLSIDDLNTAGKLSTAIGTYRAALKEAETTQEQLSRIDESMQKVANAIGRLSLVFDEIAQKLTDIDGWRITWAQNPAFFTALEPGAIEQWGSTVSLCKRYVAIISGG